MIAELENSLVWGAPERLKATRGEFIVREAAVNDTAREFWRTQRLHMIAMGYSLTKDRKGNLSVSHWFVAPPVDQEALQRVHAMSHATKTTFEPPAPAGLRYFDYQKAGIDFAWTVKNVLIGDEMGLGKTIQALGVLNLMHARESVRWTLIVTMANLRINWRREIATWLTFESEVLIARGLPPAKLEDAFTSQRPRVVIISYDSLPEWREQLVGIPWDLYVADEAHHLRNPDGLRSSVAFSIRGRRMVFMTGTPMTNRPRDIWAIIHHLQPTRYNNYSEFAKKYCDAKKKQIGRDRYVWDDKGASNLDELRADLRSHVMVRRMKAEVQKDLPKKIRQIIEMPQECADDRDELGLFHEEELKLISLRLAVENAMIGDDVKAYERAVAALDRAIKVSFKDMSKVLLKNGLRKLPGVVLHLRELINSGQKVICFVHHTEVADRLMREFKDIAVKITGGMTPEAKQVSVDRFQNEDQVRLFVGNIGAAGTGLNLTAANVVVFAELDWVPGNMQQAEDRAHRIGQISTVLVQLLVLERSIDVRIAQVLCAKLAITDQALDGAGDSNTVVFPWAQASAGADATPTKLAEEGAALTAAQVAAILKAVRMLASFCDHGRSSDNAGFNQIDAPIGHSLAGMDRLTPKQAALGLRLVKRYHRQLPEDYVARAMGTALQTAETAQQGVLTLDFGGGGESIGMAV